VAQAAEEERHGGAEDGGDDGGRDGGGTGRGAGRGRVGGHRDPREGGRGERGGGDGDGAEGLGCHFLTVQFAGLYRVHRRKGDAEEGSGILGCTGAVVFGQR
jgi:hypothetical protein